MKALLLAGGRGTRLQPYTTIIPKPLMPVGSRPVIEILLLQLRAAGITEVVLAVGYLGHLLRAFFGNGERLEMKVSYVDESTPLGTAGPIGAALPNLGDRFLLMNGDLLTTLDFRNLIQFHDAHGAAATIGAYRRDLRIDFGVLQADETGRLVHYNEKPSLHYLVSMGVYVLDRCAVEPHVLPIRQLDAPELMQLMVADGRDVYCYREDCYWLDIGRPEDYKLANEIVDQGKLELPEADL